MPICERHNGNPDAVNVREGLTHGRRLWMTLARWNPPWHPSGNYWMTKQVHPREHNRRISRIIPDSGTTIRQEEEVFCFLHPEGPPPSRIPHRGGRCPERGCPMSSAEHPPKLRREFPACWGWSGLLCGFNCVQFACNLPYTPSMRRSPRELTRYAYREHLSTDKCHGKAEIIEIKPDALNDARH